jgi:hypothetical protein
MTAERTQPAKGTCHLCDEDTDDILGHLRVIHPDIWDGIERWPDGGFVVYDETVETPEDIG